MHPRMRIVMYIVIPGSTFINRYIFMYVHNKVTSIDVLPSKNQALCKYYTLASKLKHC